MGALSRRGSGRGGDYWVPGERAVTELLRAAPGRARRIWLDERREFPELRALADAAGVRVEGTSAERIANKAPGVASRGALALADPPPPAAVDELAAAAGLIVALDGVLDPQNLGAIMRCADFFGAVGLLWTKDRAAKVTPTVVRASAGASERLPLCIVTNLDDALRRLKAADVWVLGTVAEGRGRPRADGANGPPAEPALRGPRLRAARAAAADPRALRPARADRGGRGPGRVAQRRCRLCCGPGLGHYADVASGSGAGAWMGTQRVFSPPAWLTLAAPTPPALQPGGPNGRRSHRIGRSPARQR